MEKIAVIGTGVMGRGIAQLIASSGLDVVLIGRSPGRAEQARADIGYRLEKKAAERAPGILAHLRISCLDRIRGSTFDIAIEAIAEDRAAKVDVLGQVAPCSPVLATNTSSLSVSDLGAAVGCPEKMIGLHFFNPPAAMKLVELVMGVETGTKAKAAALDLIARLGRIAIEVEDSPGFVVNRLLFAQFAEALATLESKIAGAREIDMAMTIGLGHPMGPFALMDLIGLDVCLAIFESLGAPNFQASPRLRQLVADGRLGKKTGAGFYDYL